jgi:hypothetical protein
MGSMLNINQLARKENLVIHLDASPANYTAYEFNSGSRNGTNASVLDWPNRWTDLSGNNNHAYPIRAITADDALGITGYSSSFYNFTSSYLDTSVDISGVGSLGSITDKALRFNPIQETTSPLSIFLWVKLSSTVLNYYWIANKRSGGTTPAGQLYWNIICSAGRNFIWELYDSSNSIIAEYTRPTVVNLNTWYQVGFTVDNSTAGSRYAFYFNGQPVNTGTLSGNMNVGSRQIVIGRPDWGSNSIRSRFWLSQFLVYNAALTSQEVWDNYQITKYKHQT